MRWVVVGRLCLGRYGGWELSGLEVSVGCRFVVLGSGEGFFYIYRLGDVLILRRIIFGFDLEF